MSLDADAIVDRRRMRRKLTFWRVSAALVALVALVGAGFALLPGNRLSAPGAYIARVKIQGLIRNNEDRVEALSRGGARPGRGGFSSIPTARAARGRARRISMPRGENPRRKSRPSLWWTA